MKNEMTLTSPLYSLRGNQLRTYAFSVAFIIGNVLLPQLMHMIPEGGVQWLPIYFFTLVGAYKYGRFVGLLTAVVSPLVNSLLFGMPAFSALPSIWMKSVLLALISAYVAQRYHRATLKLLLLVVLAYQMFGLLGEWILVKDLYLAAQDFRIGIPGMLFQIIGGYVVINKIIRR